MTSVIVMQNAFTSVGHIVELPDLPTDPPERPRSAFVLPQAFVETAPNARFARKWRGTRRPPASSTTSFNRQRTADAAGPNLRQYGPASRPNSYRQPTCVGRHRATPYSSTRLQVDRIAAWSSSRSDGHSEPPKHSEALSVRGPRAARAARFPRSCGRARSLRTPLVRPCIPGLARRRRPPPAGSGPRAPVDMARGPLRASTVGVDSRVSARPTPHLRSWARFAPGG